MKKTFLASLLLSLLVSSVAIAFASTATAGTTIYDCKLKSRMQDGWIPPRILVILDTDKMKARVFDGIIKEVLGDWTTAQVTPRRNEVYQLNWTVEGIPVSNINVEEKAQYKLTLNTNKKSVTARAVLSYFENDPSGWGKCTIAK